jgi:hypothetical protein
MELCIYHSFKVQVEGLEGEHISRMCRCTGWQSWRVADRENDCVWAKLRSRRCYGALNWRLPGQLQRQFEIKLQHRDIAFVEYWLTLALTAIPENMGNMDHILQFVQVRMAPPAIAVQVLSVGNIIGFAHVIAEIATSNITGDGPNKRWIVNSHRDLATCNDVYNLYRENWILRVVRRPTAREGRLRLRLEGNRQYDGWH